MSAPSDTRPIASAGRFGMRALVLWMWAAFWTLMLALGLIEFWRDGGTGVWHPLVDYGTSAIVSSAVFAGQVRRAGRRDDLLGRPLAWIAREVAWLPLIAPLYVVVVYAMRHGIHALAGTSYRHGPWGETMIYESIKFTVFYLLFTGVHFGIRSYREWVAQRLMTEQQARLAKETQLLQLAQQLQPHFLFNALNTISSLIPTDPALADALLIRLATLLRAVTDAGRNARHALSEELALLEAYASIMVQRFADRVVLTWDVSPDVRDCLVPTLCLQPLLENCFRHAVERHARTTRLVVRAWRDDGQLRIEIEDDGDAAPAARPSGPPGVGLENVRQRLHALHGDAGVLRAGAMPPPGRGFLVRLDLPCAS